MPNLSSLSFWRPLVGALLLFYSACGLAKTEYDIKAAYLYNFIKFVTWPDGNDNEAPLQVCLFGKDPINEKLTPLANLRVNNRDLVVTKVADQSSLTACSVLYISREEERHAQQLIERVGNSPVLIVSDIPGFAKLGGTIGFITLGNVIRFDVNLTRSRSSRLSISSKLLELANQVVK